MEDANQPAVTEQPAGETSVTEGSQPPAGGERTQAEGEIKAEEKAEEGRIPMSRWNAKLKAERELKARLGELEGKLNSNQKAIELYDWLKENPTRFRSLMDLIEGKQGREPQEDPYSEFAPEVAAKFRELDDLKNWKAVQERDRQAYEQRTISENRSELDVEFDNMLIGDGFVSKDGSFDEGLVTLISKATLATMMEIARDPHKPTKGELKEAYKRVTSGLSAVEKNAFKKAVRSDVPQTGSKTGIPQVNGKPRSREDRIADIVNGLNV